MLTTNQVIVRNQRRDRAFFIFGIALTAACLGVLALLLGDLLYQGARRIDWGFL